jgi:hypothetical protein
MILFVSGATVTVRKWRTVGELINPAAGNSPDSLKLNPGYWAMDNYCYSGFDAEAFVRMLERFFGRKGCRFVAAPDVVGDAHQTLVQWPFWSRLIRGVGFVPALVAQDGLTISDVPWKELSALFIGGTTEWKLGPQARDLMAYAQTRGLWVHVGRVNSRSRIWHFGRLANSWDGGQYSMFPDRRIPEGVADAESLMAQGQLLA